MGFKHLMLLIAVVLTTIIAGCGQPSPSPDLPEDTGDRLKGVSFSPRTYDQAGFEEFFSLSKEAGRLVTWAGDIDQLGVPGQGPEYVTTMSSRNGLEPVMIVTYYSQSEGRLLRPLDEAAKERYLEKLSAYAKDNQPEYMGLGIEVNIMAEKSPAGFEDFVDFYGEAYDAIKAASPRTKVFPVFQLERMKGLHGGLYGGKNDPGSDQWELLDRFGKADLYAFTTYPCLIYEDPSDIPPDYYAEIRDHTSKPVAFTEIGWYSGTPAPGWESDEAEQARFVSDLFTRTSELGPVYYIWSFMYDPNVPEPFTTMGLRGTAGGEKQAWNEWIRAD